MTEPPEAHAPILIADDAPLIRDLFRQALEAEGFETLTAADGVEAAEIAESRPLSLVILDSRMPRLDGRGVLERLRAREATRTLPIILVTVETEITDRVEALELGADDYLTKPVALEELVARVRAQLRSRAAWTSLMRHRLEEHRKVSAALRGVRVGESPERTAESIVRRLSPALGFPAALLQISAAGSVVPLASRGFPEELFSGTAALPEPLARYLRGRAREGPWVQTRVAEAGAGLDELRKAFTAAGLAACAYVPLPGAKGPLGLVAVGIPEALGGGAPAPEPADPLPVLVEAADLVAALLRPGLEAASEEESRRAALRKVISRATFRPRYQRIVSLTDGHTVGYEALTQFASGERPDVLFREAERLSLGYDLEVATLRAAVAGARQLEPGLPLHVNVSPGLIQDNGRLPGVLREADRPLVLEFTEHQAVADYEDLRAAIRRLDPEVHVAVDDAGSGYASLRHILALRPDFVKLDIDWVRAIDGDPARQALVSGLAYFAGRTGCALIGEGIETEPERDTLRGLGILLGQGYLFGRPEPAAGGPGGGPVAG